MIILLKTKESEGTEIMITSDFIDRELEAYRERLEDQAVFDIESQIENELERLVDDEKIRILGDPDLQGDNYEAYMKKFTEDTERALNERFTKESNEEIERLVTKRWEELEEEYEDQM